MTQGKDRQPPAARGALPGADRDLLGRTCGHPGICHHPSRPCTGRQEFFDVPVPTGAVVEGACDHAVFHRVLAAPTFRNETVKVHFVRTLPYPTVFRQQKADLILVKGGPGSRMLRQAHRISTEGRDRAGRPLKVLSPGMQKVFGDFGGNVSIQRSPPRWVEAACVDRAIEFLKDLE